MTLHSEVGGNADTGSDNLIPSTTPKPLSGSPIQQVGRLKQYLATSFPDAARPDEYAADTAIRLLQGMTVTSGTLNLSGGALLVDRCSQQYCNSPAGHSGEHGWINYG